MNHAIGYWSPNFRVILNIVANCIYLTTRVWSVAITDIVLVPTQCLVFNTGMDQWWMRQNEITCFLLHGLCYRPWCSTANLMTDIIRHRLQRTYTHIALFSIVIYSCCHQHFVIDLWSCFLPNFNRLRPIKQKSGHHGCHFVDSILQSISIS